MTYFAQTRRLFGRVDELDVFATGDERDRWVAAVPDEPDVANGYEEGPRTALTGSEAHDGFRDDDDMPVYPWVVLHAGVRPSGMRGRAGTVHVPGWMDLHDYSEQPNGGNGIDWTRDVTLVWDGWTNG